MLQNFLWTGGKAVKILMLGNSYTYFNDLPGVIAEMTGWQVDSNTRGGARLVQQLDPADPLGAKTLELLKAHWDYVVLQEYSNGPVVAKAEFLDSAKKLGELIRKQGGTSVFYATWAYAEGGAPLKNMNMEYGRMCELLEEAYGAAAAAENGVLAKVGRAFAERPDRASLYDPDGSHPSKEGTALAAEVIIKAIREHAQKRDGN